MCCACRRPRSINELFPGRAPFAKLGYVHQAIHGQKAYHGVAILSRLPFREDRHAGFLPRRPCPPHGRDASRTAWSCTISTCRPAATFPIPRRMTNSPTSCISWREMEKFFAPAQSPAQRSRDPGGRSQCRAAGKRCLEPQAACWTWSATRRSRRGCWARRRRPSTGPTSTRALHSAGGENLFLVELSRRRLGSVGSRPPARPCLGSAPA